MSNDIINNIASEKIQIDNIITNNIITIDDNITKNDNIIKNEIDKTILVISGGGIKGFVALGALQKLYDTKKLININKYCGTSVGAIISLLLIIGYKPV